MHTRTPEEIGTVLGQLSMFHGLSEKQLQPFINAARRIKLEKGTVLYNEGDEATHFYIVVSGWLKLSHSTSDGMEIVLGMHSRNEVLGEYALFEDRTYKNSAFTVTQVAVLSIPIALLAQQVDEVPQITRNLLVGMVKCQRRHERQAIQHMLYDASQRIGGFVLGLLKSKRQDGVVVTLPYDKALVAATLNMRGATFSRALQMLRKEAGVEVQGNKVTIHSVERLVDYAGPCHSQVYPVEKKSCLT